MASGTGMLLVYIVGWGIVFGTFVHYYHKRKAQSLAKLESWYPAHSERDIYYSLVTLRKNDPEAVTDAVMKASLLRRAMTDIMRAVEIQGNKQTLTALVKSGAISEELQHQFTAAEAELEAEMLSVVQEAEKLQKGWGNSIFQVASEMVNNTRLRELKEEMSRLNFESANCVRSIKLEEMTPEERTKATTQGTKENEHLKKSDLLLSSVFNLPIGEAANVVAATQAKKQAIAKAVAQSKATSSNKKADPEVSASESPVSSAKSASIPKEKTAATGGPSGEKPASAPASTDDTDANVDATPATEEKP